jgi:hypothetical protein
MLLKKPLETSLAPTGLLLAPVVDYSIVLFLEAFGGIFAEELPITVLRVCFGG